MTTIPEATLAWASEATDAAPLLEVRGLKKAFDRPSSLGAWFSGKRTNEAYSVAGVSFHLERGQCLGIAGESGSGKTTLIRMLAGLLAPSGGDISYRGRPLRFDKDRRDRAAVQMVFQDPTESLNPSFTVREIITDPLRNLLDMRDPKALRLRVAELADRVQLPSALLERYPHQLSGGQKARVGIARALAPQPEILLLDEPTTALDVSVQAKVLLLLSDLRTELDMSCVFVSHDLSVVRLLCDQVMIMQRGQVVESGPVGQVFQASRHEYTRSLLSAVPVLTHAR